MSGGQYIHGTDAAEQARLADMNRLINDRCLEQMRLRGGEAVIDFGSGLGQMSLAIARQVGSGGGGGRVVGIERDERQLAEARALLEREGRGLNVEFRQGDVFAPPLTQGEWGSFDVAHTRFVLEHVPDPLGVVKQMVRAVRRGGRIFLADDDHDVLRLWPEVEGFAALWGAYMQSYTRLGNDPDIGRKLPALLHAAGARPVRATGVVFGGCAGDPAFPTIVSNLVRVVQGAVGTIVEQRLLARGEAEKVLARVSEWGRRPDAALWYQMCFAEGVTGTA